MSSNHTVPCSQEAVYPAGIIYTGSTDDDAPGAATGGDYLAIALTESQAAASLCWDAADLPSRTADEAADTAVALLQAVLAATAPSLIPSAEVPAASAPPVSKYRWVFATFVQWLASQRSQHE